MILGDSIACNGICLTVVDLLPTGQPTAFVVDVSDETLRCATGLTADGALNLEKALRLADRLGGVVADVEAGLGLVSADLAPLLPPKYLTVWLVVSGVITEIARRSRATDL